MVHHMDCLQHWVSAVVVDGTAVVRCVETGADMAAVCIVSLKLMLMLWVLDQVP
jgi:hypothetical protein